MPDRTHTRGLPSWLRPLNKVFAFLQRRGVRLEGMFILTTHGRVSGKPVTNPVTPVHLHGNRYLVSFPESHWAANARATPRATLRHGKNIRDVDLVEVPTHERPRVLREFPAQIPFGVPMMVRAGYVERGTAEEFEQLADRCPVFRADPVTDRPARAASSRRISFLGST